LKTGRVSSVSGSKNGFRRAIEDYWIETYGRVALHRRTQGRNQNYFLRAAEAFLMCGHFRRSTASFAVVCFPTITRAGGI